MSKAEEFVANSVDAIKLGDTSRGCDLLIRALQMEPENDSAWYWLSEVVSTREEQRYCLKRVLEINRNHFQAQEELEALAPGPTQRPTDLVTFDAPATPQVIRLDSSRSQLAFTRSRTILLKHPGVALILAMICAGLIWIVLYV